MEGMKPRVNREQGEPHIPHLRPQKEGFSEGLWGSMRLMPFQSLSSFGEHPRSPKGTFDLALDGQRENDPLDKEEGGTPDGESSRAKAWPCEDFR